ncbi:conserved hypothetical protein [Candidatus Methylobacter favarea]|uniref:Uncharacterized protein n=1 Tax=Candidatus Methylobacter favarea TaxID=2707345 RepID=A0A8S0Y8T6_9GAMM|nr:hypothetical protein [Candidatus Methylobacter favarea]CAA9889276.1 conserved hypothetical protein [Candidatus Methylobacter favarea]
MERCPCCNARLAGAQFCPRCQADLGSVLGSEQFARHCLSKALQCWLADDRQLTNLALAKSIFLKQTPLALVFRDFIIRQQCENVLGLLEKKKYPEAKESLSLMRDLHPDDKFLTQLYRFTKYLLVKDIIKFSSCKPSESSMSSNPDSLPSSGISNC